MTHENARYRMWSFLKHPHWQRKRLAILNRSEFSCEDCGTIDKTLHIHHSYYEKGLKPWEYPDESLHALCEDCHRRAQDRLLLLHRQLGALELGQIEQLYGYALGLESQSYPQVVLDVFSHEVAQGVSDGWRLPVQLVLDTLTEGRIDGYRLHALQAGRTGG